LRWPDGARVRVAVGLFAVLFAMPVVAGSVHRAVSLGYAQQYDSAWATLARVSERDTLAPLVAFWRAALVQMLLYDSGDPALADSFHRTSDRALAACRERLRTHPDDARAHLLFGLTQLNRANCQGWQRSRLRAVMTLNSASRSLGRAVALDSTLADGWFGLAAIEYVRVNADRYALGLGLLGSRKRAYRMIARSLDGEGWLANAAGFMLAYMHKEDGEFEQAVEVCERILRQYPENRTGLRLLRDTYLAAGRWEDALQVAGRLDSSITRDFPGNRYGRSENRLVAMKAWDGLGLQDSALAYADRIIAWSRYERQVPWLDRYVAEARQYRRRCER